MITIVRQQQYSFPVVGLRGARDRRVTSFNAGYGKFGRKIGTVNLSTIEVVEHKEYGWSCYHNYSFDVRSFNNLRTACHIKALPQRKGYVVQVSDSYPDAESHNWSHAIVHVSKVFKYKSHAKFHAVLWLLLNSKREQLELHNIIKPREPRFKFQPNINLKPSIVLPIVFSFLWSVVCYLFSFFMGAARAIRLISTSLFKLFRPNRKRKTNRQVFQNATIIIEGQKHV